MTQSQVSHSYIGCIDRFADGVVCGWVIDRANLQEPVGVHVIIDGQETEYLLADELRQDLQRAPGHPTGKVGFRYSLPSTYFDGQEHRLSFRMLGDVVLCHNDSADPARAQRELVFQMRQTTKVDGYLEGFRHGQFVGWVTRTVWGGNADPGGCHVLVTCNGVRVAQVRANRHRPDVARARHCDSSCGFQLTVPPAFRSASPREFKFEVMPEGIELQGSPLVTSTIDDHLAETLSDVSGQLDALFQQFVKLRRRLTDLAPASAYSLADYDQWARAYYPALRARTAAQRLARSPSHDYEATPLVSVLMPAYRPTLSDFVAAVESVITQTYQNWELVIVDDGSRQVDLTAQIKAFCQRDRRIRRVVHKQNRGISAATNTAIEAARGAWVAFFDHDDLLVDVAIETLIDHAQRAGARVLYTDEDKVNAAGRFSEPNFKPDWNYRYLLGCNYICHLLFVARDALVEVGPLESRYDGAQDHDLILRLSELIPPRQIHHVPEVLYHWRLTPSSTAADVLHKGYAVQAGCLAVSDHLARRGIPATVESLPGLTIYNPVWQLADEPNVCIVIPFKDEVKNVRKCLEAVLNGTGYGSFEILLIDNWSATADAVAFVLSVRHHRNVRVMRVEEEGFNLSRLNNLGAANTQAPFILFLTGEVVPLKPDWLSLLCKEALLSDNVAAVAGRYLDPDGTVRHAGIAVGQFGIATPLHKGVRFDEFGFGGRLALSNEVTCVTADCMLVRASTFHQVGGFDEAGIKSAYNEVDLCLKIRSAGYRIIYCANMIGVHCESGIGLYKKDFDRNTEHFVGQHQLLERWSEHSLFRMDPAYNLHLGNLDRTFEDLNQPL